MPETRMGRKRRIEKLKRQLDSLVIDVEEIPLEFWLTHRNRDTKRDELDRSVTPVSLKPSDHVENNNEEPGTQANLICPSSSSEEEDVSFGCSFDTDDQEVNDSAEDVPQESRPVALVTPSPSRLKAMKGGNGKKLKESTPRQLTQSFQDPTMASSKTATKTPEQASFRIQGKSPAAQKQLFPVASELAPKKAPRKPRGSSKRKAMSGSKGTEKASKRRIAPVVKKRMRKQLCTFDSLAIFASPGTAKECSKSIVFKIPSSKQSKAVRLEVEVAPITKKIPDHLLSVLTPIAPKDVNYSVGPICLPKKRAGRPKGSKNKSRAAASTSPVLVESKRPAGVGPLPKVVALTPVLPKDAQHNVGSNNLPKRKPGRPKGSKTLPKRKPGRPKGSKTLPKRKPGRPKGSKNNPRTTAQTLPVAQESESLPVETLPPSPAVKRGKREGGRSKGSTSKSKSLPADVAELVTPTEDDMAPSPAVKRGKREGGRSKGSTNKSKSLPADVAQVVTPMEDDTSGLLKGATLVPVGFVVKKKAKHPLGSLKDSKIEESMETDSSSISKCDSESESLPVSGRKAKQSGVSATRLATIANRCYGSRRAERPRRFASWRNTLFSVYEDSSGSESDSDEILESDWEEESARKINRENVSQKAEKCSSPKGPLKKTEVVAAESKGSSMGVASSQGSASNSYKKSDYFAKAKKVQPGVKDAAPRLPVDHSPHSDQLKPSSADDSKEENLPMISVCGASGTKTRGLQEDSQSVSKCKRMQGDSPMAHLPDMSDNSIADITVESVDTKEQERSPRPVKRRRFNFSCADSLAGSHADWKENSASNPAKGRFSCGSQGDTKVSDMKKQPFEIACNLSLAGSVAGESQGIFPSGESLPDFSVDNFDEHQTNRRDGSLAGIVTDESSCMSKLSEDSTVRPYIAEKREFSFSRKSLQQTNHHLSATTGPSHPRRGSHISNQRSNSNLPSFDTTPRSRFLVKTTAKTGKRRGRRKEVPDERDIELPSTEPLVTGADLARRKRMWFLLQGEEEAF
jgi:hypothetical protein